MKLKLPGRMSYLRTAQSWKRAFALLIDLFILDFFVFSAFAAFFSNLSYSSLLSSPSLYYRAMILGFFMMFFSYIYFFSLEYLLGQTIGKYFFNIYVVDEKFDKISVGQALLRNIELIPLFPFYLFIFIDIFYFLFKSRRTLDVLSRTNVIEKGIY